MYLNVEVCDGDATIYLQFDEYDRLAYVHM
jgi:hypothetical protein